ncbi:hypothetical protein E3N88_04144 [Mikania micrantha]|uniref:Uncharacterized protein n=1 Tax=Mikania micrantha TaxID=192012 RepID=A0A5N6PVF4_9ASTR|nr:hypothetical protein E3N88_04144 [Mikania micrantha]
MSDLQECSSPIAAVTLPPQSATTESPSAPPGAHSPPRFDPRRTIGIIKRKALIKDLAAVYHAECLAYCQVLSELQKKCEEKKLSIGKVWYHSSLSSGLHGVWLPYVLVMLLRSHEFVRMVVSEVLSLNDPAAGLSGCSSALPSQLRPP